MRTLYQTFLILTLLVLPTHFFANAQTNEDAPEETPRQEEFIVNAGPARDTYTDKSISFNIAESRIPENEPIKEVLWSFGDGVSTTGEEVRHAYPKPGTYKVTLTISTDQQTKQASTEVRVFKNVILLIADTSAPEDQLLIYQQQAAKEDVLLLTLRTRVGGPEALVEEELTNQLLDSRDAVGKASLIITWTSGGVGPNVLSKFVQHIRQSEGGTAQAINAADKGIIIASETPFGILAPVAQSTYDQMQSAYVLLTKPQAIPLVLSPMAAEEAKQVIFDSPITHRVLGAFSSRTVNDINPANFISFGINYLVNQGVPINNIVLILMLPIIATILSFSRQVIGIKAFGIITPALTALTFLVMGLQYGLIVFSTILLAGTLTRLVMRKLHLLYLPRMALVLTSISLSILVLFGFGAVVGQAPILSFSIFPILILTLLAEEFIAVQFKSGAKAAFTITALTLLLAISCYFIVSWQLFRTIIVSYPEVVLLCIPINILLGRWTGLRLTEYFRFRNLLRYAQ